LIIDIRQTYETGSDDDTACVVFLPSLLTFSSRLARRC
jgi:hypothetical protein